MLSFASKASAKPVLTPDVSSDPSFATHSEGEETAVNDDSYIQKTLLREKPLPPITLGTLWKNLQTISFFALSVVPIVSIYGALTTTLTLPTFIWAVVYYFFTGLGITAGYHRLWAHRSYNASLPLQYFLALAGSGAFEGSIKWWSRGHRAHHRYTDTALDPYDANKGFFWSHVGWMLVKPRRKPGHADVSDLVANPVIQWQQRWYVPLLLTMSFIVPTIIAGLGWGDWRGGFFYSGAARLLFVHHSTFCVNSLAHWLGDQPFDSRKTPRDHVVTAFATLGEGYHNFHHEFPQDYRNAIKFYQYDPTKWFILVCHFLGVASELKTFPSNEIKKGVYNQKLKALQRERRTIHWPKNNDELPVLTFEDFQKEAKTSGRALIVIGGYIHDVSDFIHDHPGGLGIIKSRLGRDATTAFYGGIYEHSNAAHNLLAMMRVGCIEGGYDVLSLRKKPLKGLEVYDGPSVKPSLSKDASAKKVDDDAPHTLDSTRVQVMT